MPMTHGSSFQPGQRRQIFDHAKDAAVLEALSKLSSPQCQGELLRYRAEGREETYKALS